MVGALMLARAHVLGFRPDAPVPIAWVIERPVKYDRKHGAHKDVDALLRVVNALRRIVRPLPDRIEGRAPQQWKGNTPKRVHHQRIVDADVFDSEERGIALPYLSPDSRCYQKDVADAIGLGLFELGRVQRGGVVYR